MKNTLKYLPGQDNGSIKPVSVSDIDLIKIEDGVMSIFTKGKRLHLKFFRSLDALMAKLNQDTFFRANRNTLIHIEKISKIIPYSQNSYSIVMSGGTEVRSCRKRNALLMERLGWK